MPIVHMYDKITEALPNNQIVCSVYIDLKKHLIPSV